jgi:hypothetical protein
VLGGTRDKRLFGALQLMKNEIRLNFLLIAVTKLHASRPWTDVTHTRARAQTQTHISVLNEVFRASAQSLRASAGAVP